MSMLVHQSPPLVFISVDNFIPTLLAFVVFGLVFKAPSQ